MKSFQRGALLIAAIVLVVIIAALVTAMSFLTVSNIGASGSHMSSAQAFFVANSGLERALFQYSKLDTDCASLTNTNLAVGAGSFSTTGTVYPTAVNSTLSAAITNAATTIPVASITGYAPHGRILIENEEIDYAGTSTSAADCGTAPCFVGSKRGANGTTAAAHGSAVAVYQPNQCLIQSTGTAGSAKRVMEAVVRELSVQTGQATIPDNSSTPQSVTVTISPVNPNRSFVVCGNYNDDEHDSTRITCELTTPSTLVIKNGGTATSSVSGLEFVQWYVVEFMSGVTVQRGLANFPSGTATVDVPINAVTLANTFVYNSERVSQDQLTRDERWTTRARLTTTTNLAFDRNETGTVLDVAWQVIQINSAAVQSGTTTIAAGSASNNGGITLVDTAKTFLVFSRTAGGAANGVEREYTTRGRIQSTGLNVNFDRPPAPSPMATGVSTAWFAVSMTDGTTVQSGTDSPSASGNFKNITLPTAIVLSRSIPIISVMGDPADTATGSLGAVSFIACFATNDACTATSTTNLRLRRENVTNKNATISWFVVQFASQFSILDRREGYP